MNLRTSSLALSAATLALLFAPSLASAQGELAGWNGEGDEVNMPLVDETVRVTIDRQHAHTVYSQSYQNEQAVQVEGRYRLLAGEGARVDGFAYWNGEEKIVGEVFERNAAQAVYREVTGFGRDPGLLEQTGEGAFTFRVFPIAPGERKRVQISFGQWLTAHGNRMEYRVPVRRDDASVVVRLSDDRPITSITSATHELTLRRTNDREVEVHVDGRKAGASSEELVLSYEVDAPDWTLSARVHRDAGQDPYLVLSVPVPARVAERSIVDKDVTLVLDRSGSMSGEPIRQAREAAIDLVGRLRNGDRLNIVAFDDDTESLYPTPRRVSDEVRDEAIRYIRRIDDGGGTDIAGALRDALAAQHSDSRPHVVLFLTDGQSDASAALTVAESDRRDARIYTIGVGHGVQRPLLSRLASHHRGRFTFIASADAITDQMGRLYEQLAAPVLVSPELAFDGIRPYRQYPQSLPDLYMGDELVIATRLLSGGSADVKLRGRLDGRPVELSAHIDVGESEEAPWVGRMWAAKRVDDLLEEIALSGTTEGRQEEVVELALAYAFTTPYTSFLAIPESEMTGAARDMVESMRERRRAILAANPDAAALSRSAMPPGDPVIRVQAPADAQQVTAFFPFGLELDLTYDPAAEAWTGRFLVPNDVVDGEYDVRVLVVDDGGDARIVDVPYTIVSDEPEMDFEVEAVEGGVRVRVSAEDGVRLATVAVVDDPTLRADLEPLSDERTSWETTFALTPGTHVLRVVAADQARNETEHVVTVTVQ